MIARIWHRTVPASKAQECLHLMRTIALPKYQSILGNRGAWCLSRTEGDLPHLEMLSFWDDTAVIQRFAGAASRYPSAKNTGLHGATRRLSLRSPERHRLGRGSSVYTPR